jgi:hypothetical protein
MARILTMLQFQGLYGVGAKTTRRLLHSGEVGGLKTGAGWRILDPGPVLLELVRHQTQELVAVPFVRGVEASALLRISSRRLRQLAESGKIEFKLRGTRRLYALQSLLDYMASRGDSRDQHDGYRRPWVMAWARELIDRKLPEYFAESDLPDSAPDTPSANHAQRRQ